MPTLDGVWIGEGRSRVVLCPQCGASGDYSMSWDSAYCRYCFHWLEQPCKCGPDCGCPYVGRPEIPNLWGE